MHAQLSIMISKIILSLTLARGLFASLQKSASAQAFIPDTDSMLWAVTANEDGGGKFKTSTVLHFGALSMQAMQCQCSKVSLVMDFANLTCASNQDDP